MRKIILAFLMVSTSLLSSCSLDNQMEQVSIGDIKHVEMHGVTLNRIGFDVFVDASNMSNKNIQLKDLRIDFKSQDDIVMTLFIKDDVKLPKNWEGELKLPMLAEFNGLALALATLPNTLSQTTVEIDCVVKAGGMRKRFRIKDISLQEFGRMSGLQMSTDMNNFLQEYIY